MVSQAKGTRKKTALRGLKTAKEANEQAPGPDSANAPVFPDEENLTLIGEFIDPREIKDRIGGDIRPIDQTHVRELAESIARRGFHQPIVVDTKNRLVAGGHRREAALLLLAGEDEKLKAQFLSHYSDGRIPVLRKGFDSEQEPGEALLVEVEENEKRRDLSKADIVTLYRKWEAEGKQTGGKGRGKKNVALRDLELVVRKSRAQLLRYLREDKEEAKSTISGKANPVDIALEKAQKAIKKAVVASFASGESTLSDNEIFILDQLYRSLGQAPIVKVKSRKDVNKTEFAEDIRKAIAKANKAHEKQ